MYYILAFSLESYIPLMVQVLITIAAIFGGAGYWEWRIKKDQAKRDKESKESGAEKKLDDLKLGLEKVTSDVQLVKVDVQEVKTEVQRINQDIELLKSANEAATQYRESLDKTNAAMINSMTALMRERLLAVADKCITQGYYSKEEREIYGKLFECYTGEPFNGDGVIHDLQPIVKALPWAVAEEDAPNR